MLLEQTLDLPARSTGIKTERLHLQRLFQIGVHQIDHLPQRATDGHIQGGFDAPVTGRFKRQDIFDTVSQRLVMQTPDPLQRHVESPRWTGRRQAVAIHHVGFAGDLAEPGDFRQRRTMLRVYGAAIAVEQSGLPEKPGAVPDASQRNPLFGGVAQ
ncbi:hypothetical protein D3C76_1305060 [compost metagenome]